MICSVDAEVPELVTALSSCCADEECRRGALDLVADLMTASVANMEEGVGVVSTIHYQSGILEKR